MYMTFFFEEFLKFLQQNFTVCVIHVLFDCCCKITTTTTNLTILDYCGFFAQCFSLSVLKSVSIVFFFLKSYLPVHDSSM